MKIKLTIDTDEALAIAQGFGTVDIIPDDPQIIYEDINGPYHIILAEGITVTVTDDLFEDLFNILNP